MNEVLFYVMEWYVGDRGMVADVILEEKKRLRGVV